MSGGLDRLSAEDDPCVRFDPTSKLWIYLHNKRTISSPQWKDGMSENLKYMADKNSKSYYGTE